jgi:hypothetical protein
MTERKNEHENVLSLDAYKEKLKMQLAEIHYQAFLQSLSDTQLEIESQYLVDQTRLNPNSADFKLKIPQLFQEMARRTDSKIFQKAIHQIKFDMEHSLTKPLIDNPS